MWIGQYANIEDDLLGSTMLDPTMVTLNISYTFLLEIMESFFYDDILNKFKILNTPLLPFGDTFSNENG